MDAGLQERPTQSEEENYGDRMMVTASTLVGENPAMVHNPGSDGRPPIQETGDGEILHSQPAQVGSNADNMAYVSSGAPDLEEELGGVIIEILVMSVETFPAIVHGL
jgi:hypothetical protein